MTFRLSIYAWPLPISSTSPSPPVPMPRRVFRDMRDKNRGQRNFRTFCMYERPGVQIAQIYEGTNQIQRMVMARQLLKGW
jgi:hypothetical protein